MPLSSFVLRPSSLVFRRSSFVLGRQPFVLRRLLGLRDHRLTVNQLVGLCLAEPYQRAAANGAGAARESGASGVEQRLRVLQLPFRSALDAIGFHRQSV